MKDLFPVKVECLAGNKADEYPRSFFIDNIRFTVVEILDRWYQFYSPDKVEGSETYFPAANYYKVLTSDRKIYILKHETETNNWFLWIKGESMNLP